MKEIDVLIVEDDIKIAEIHSAYLKKMEHFKVIGIATSITEAKKLLSIVQPDLILLDVYFPEGSGIDFLWDIRKEACQIDVIMVTAAKEIKHVSEAIRGGAFDYIIKPIVFERFERTLKKYKGYKLKINQSANVDQRIVDGLFQREREEEAEVKEKNVPKGIDPITLEKIESYMKKGRYKGETAEEIGKELGVSRTTSRRYLEYMVSIGKAKPELTYGNVGRPERRYTLIHSESAN
ncbi:response regulator [Siminovitchia fortis]|uniref:response regulator n=1 Tax=Siminovitchia fortis TaxID=254758 RepID=UPI0011A71ADC|nr:response regulator [Siminovitchia fortis]